MNALASPRVSKVITDYVEKTLGFGEPVKATSYAALFNDKPPPVRYTALNGHASCDVNSLTQHGWIAMHSAYEGDVLLNVWENTYQAIGRFVDQQLATSHLRVCDVNLTDNEVSRMDLLLTSFKSFYQVYRQFDNTATSHMSVVLVGNGNGHNRDMVLRFAMFSKTGSIYLQFNFTNFIRKFKPLINGSQLNSIIKAIKSFCADFQEGFDLYSVNDKPSLVYTMVIALSENPRLSGETIYGNYIKTFNATSIATGSPDVLPEWNNLRETTQTIIDNCCSLTRAYINAYNATNAMSIKYS